VSEWWTYRPSDFLMFSAATYRRMFELYNDAFWPLQPLAVVVGIAIFGMLLNRDHAPARAVCMVLAVAWFWIAWAFHAQRYAPINWAATWFAGAFAVEALLLGAIGVVHGSLRFAATASWTSRIGLAMLLVALVYPAIGMLIGRSFNESEFFGFAPDPTAIGTLALLMLARGRAVWMLRVVPLAWCAVGGMTLWVMHDLHALLLLGAGVIAVASAARARGEPRVR
jgi:Family of unknown function (DUF6064)